MCEVEDAPTCDDGHRVTFGMQGDFAHVGQRVDVSSLELGPRRWKPDRDFSLLASRCIERPQGTRNCVDDIRCVACGVPRVKPFVVGVPHQILAKEVARVDVSVVFEIADEVDSLTDPHRSAKA